MNNFPNDKQDYRVATHYTGVSINLYDIKMYRGQYIHITADKNAIEVKMDDDGKVGVIITDEVSIKTFKEAYG